MIQGRYFDARTSMPHPARVEIGADRRVRLDSDVERRDVPLASVRISDRIADVPRRLTFDDGATFETPENDAVDVALDAAGEGVFARTLDRWERLWGIAIAALLAVGLLSWAFVKFGMPGIAEFAARAMPPAVGATIGAEGLELLDETLLSPTRLPAARQDALRRRLAAMTAESEDAQGYRLEFRRGGKAGANAFALPSGIIVVSDELVDLARRDEEIDAVLAHEIGHVRGRHSLRILLQNAGGLLRRHDVPPCRGRRIPAVPLHAPAARGAGALQMRSLGRPCNAVVPPTGWYCSFSAAPLLDPRHHLRSAADASRAARNSESAAQSGH